MNVRLQTSFSPVVLSCFALLLSISLGGCGLYINIPKQQGDVAVNSAHWAPVKEVLADSINETVKRYQLEHRPYTLTVEEGEPGWLFDDGTPIVDKIREDLLGDPISKVQPGVPLVEVLKLRIRAGSKAEVDIYCAPEADRLGETFTVFLSWNPGVNWRVDRVRIWRGGIEPDLYPDAPTEASTDGEAFEENESVPEQPEQPKGPTKVEKLDV